MKLDWFLRKSKIYKQRMETVILYLDNDSNGKLTTQTYLKYRINSKTNQNYRRIKDGERLSE